MSTAIKILHAHSGYLLCARRGDHSRCVECQVRWDLPETPKSPAWREVGKYYWNSQLRRVEYWHMTRAGNKELRCEHHSRFGSCTTCGGGSSLCECGKDEWSCKIHGIGKGRCVAHGELKAKCQQCDDGRAFCHHKNKKGRRQRKERCKECGGSELCKPHGRNKNRCIDCGGKEICIHKQWYYTCPDCPGPGACKHKGSKYNCNECRGSQICGHDIRIDHCYKCTRRPQDFCQHCKQTYVAKSPHKPYCAPCYYHLHPEVEVPSRYMGKQNYLDAFLRENLALQPTVANRTIPGGCSLRRPDWLYDCGTHVVIVECDEDAHEGYNCENKRLMQLFLDAGSRPLVMIRFNPDSYNGQKCFEFDQCNIIHPLPEVWERRSHVLLEHLIHHLENVPEREVTTVQLYYPGQEIPTVETEIDIVASKTP